MFQFDLLHRSYTKSYGIVLAMFVTTIAVSKSLLV